MTETALETEQARVERWRLMTLIDAGYPVPVAEQIARAPVDLHRAVELVRSGCDPDLAVEILL